LRKPVLEDVNVDGGVIKQLRGAIFPTAKEVELRFSARFEGISMSVRLETPQKGLKLRTQDRPQQG
jgi:hypothetical protein